MDAYRTSDDRFEALAGYDFAPRYLDQGGLRMHYVDEGEGPPVLLLHGEPTWAYLYRKLIPPLVADGLRCVGTDIVPGQLIRISLVQPVGDEVIAAYDAPFPTPESKTGIVMFPELVATSSDHPSAPAMLDVRDRLRTWDAPALILFSDSDPIFSRGAAERMAALLPNAELAPPVEGAGHFLQEDRGERISADVSAFVRRTS